MIVLTSDHGDYLGDHWLGEKDLFHDPSVRIPLIVFDPRDAAASSRGTVCEALVESIDLAATFIEALGGAVPDHVVEGRSLLPFLEGRAPESWRDVVISEYDYSATPMAAKLAVAPKEARLFMVFDGRFKMMHAEGGMRPVLFDLETDPQEFHDLGESPHHAAIRARLYERLAHWAQRPSQRTTVSDAQILARRGKSRRKGILLGVWEEGDLERELLAGLGGSSGTTVQATTAQLAPDEKPQGL
jgi:arylsulfatase A-like enzyme